MPRPPVQLYELQRKVKAPAPSKLRKDVPNCADSAVLRALSFRAEERQRSAREFAEELAGAAKRNGRLRGARYVAAAALVGACCAGAWEWRNTREIDAPAVVAIDSGRDPEEFGFAKVRDLTERTVPNADYTGFEAVRLTTSDQGHYSHPLSREQTRIAMRDGWKLAATVRPTGGRRRGGCRSEPRGRQIRLRFLRERCRAAGSTAEYPDRERHCWAAV